MASGFVPGIDRVEGVDDCVHKLAGDQGQAGGGSQQDDHDERAHVALEPASHAGALTGAHRYMARITCTCDEGGRKDVAHPAFGGHGQRAAQGGARVALRMQHWPFRKRCALSAALGTAVCEARAQLARKLVPMALPCKCSSWPVSITLQGCWYCKGACVR